MPLKYVLIGLLKAWRLLISPLYGNVCRYYPSCSAYALRAVECARRGQGQLADRPATAPLPSVGAGWLPPGARHTGAEEEIRDQALRSSKWIGTTTTTTSTRRPDRV